MRRARMQHALSAKIVCTRVSLMIDAHMYAKVYVNNAGRVLTCGHEICFGT
jgi:hypothetical protein